MACTAAYKVVYQKAMRSAWFAIPVSNSNFGVNMNMTYPKLPALMRPKTVDSVTKVFEKAINDLKQVEIDNECAAYDAEERIKEMQAKADAARNEAQRAVSVRQKLEGLVS